MPSFDAKYWNLSQASAWVVYRKRELVEQFSTETADGWRALLIYSNLHNHDRVGNLNDLKNELTLGKLTAWGRRNDIDDQLEAIPAREWNDLWISPPSVTRSHPKAGRIEPWTSLRFESKDLKKCWRNLLEIEGRSRFDWEVIKKIWDNVNERLADCTQNDKIEELQLVYNERFGDNRAPSRTSIQNHIKHWN